MRLADLVRNQKGNRRLTEHDEICYTMVEQSKMNRTKDGMSQHHQDANRINMPVPQLTHIPSHSS
jgi:hypothetical protein